MVCEIYEKVVEALTNFGGAISRVRYEEFYELVEELFTKEEAQITAHLMLFQLVPGISEYQFMRGGTTERDKKLAILFDDRHHVALDSPEAEKNRPAFPFSRVIAVEENIPLKSSLLMRAVRMP